MNDIWLEYAMKIERIATERSSKEQFLLCFGTEEARA